MEKIFINLTNHPSGKWDEKQKMEAQKYGKIIDIPFPNVDAQATEIQVRDLGRKVVDQVMKYTPAAVLCQGESTLTFQIINMLMDQDVLVVAACSERIVKEIGYKKESYLNFTQFRKYTRG